MLHRFSVESMNFLDYSSLTDSSNVEDFLSKTTDLPLTLTKLYALLRIWNKSIHENFAKLIHSTLEREINIDEPDLITGMNLLHFTCKFGARKLEHEREAVQVMKALIKKGIHLSTACSWVQMNCLHYCAFFDAPSVCELLLQQPKAHSLLNQPCPSFKNQTPLHLACSALSLSVVRVLLQAGADRLSTDDQHRTPADCIPNKKIDETQESLANAMRALLHSQESLLQQSLMIDSIISNADNQNHLQFQIEERVRLTNNKMGTIKYFGSVPFGVNLWYGIELDEAAGKHDGCVGGVRYFTCPSNRGIFVQPSSLQKLTPVPHSPERERRFRPINFPILDTSHVSSRVDSGLKRDSSADDRVTEQYQVDDRVSLSKNRHGTVKYVGSTPLGSGVWYGVELDAPDGLHDGCLSVDGQRYFHCKPQHGVFVRSQNLTKLAKNDRRTLSLSTSLDRQTKRMSRMTTSDYDATMMTSSIVEDDPFSKSIESSIQSTTFQVGDQVFCRNHRAIVRFIGTTLFADGIWIGVEFLAQSLGKNDGSVNGHVYFQCKGNYGLFVRPNRLTLTKK